MRAIGLPLAMLEVALTPKVAPSVAELLQEDTWQTVSTSHTNHLTATRISGGWSSGGSLDGFSAAIDFEPEAVVSTEADRSAKCAVFYSISSTQSGLVRAV